ncbi:hypothetical protein ACFWVC_26890 [Streptomyces sp. NPDC058691]|uniref:hypothetical protein n=1 Tax=Streptomyces sp. NPDC058691 TaxID=3346601 RepID=UPI00364A4465
MTTTDHRVEAARLLREAEATYRDSTTRPQQIAFGEEPVDRALRVAGLLTAMSHAHAALAVPALGDQMWLASYSGIPLGYYTGRDAAQKHCEDEARTVQNREGPLQWARDEDEDEPDARWELTAVFSFATERTGYIVAAITPAAAYDPQEEL